MTYPMPCPAALETLRKGVVIPASPLALDKKRNFDEKHQRAIYRYYAASGSGGIAVGVHTTQFEIRDPEIGLFQPLLEFASEAIDRISESLTRPLLKVSGVCGKTEQAVSEAALARSLGFDLGLLSLSALKNDPEDELIRHCSRVAEEIPLIGFYLQPAVGGRILSHSFWRKFVRIPNVVAVKIAPFNRYQTLDVVRALALEGREEDITLYTGNDDNIIADLLTPFPVHTPEGKKVLRIRGGLLGQWSIWTSAAVRLLEEIHGIVEKNDGIPFEMVEKNAALTDANAVVFDAANQFSGCIPGIHKVLRRQGLLQSLNCLDAALGPSPGQKEELERVYREYPWLTDDEFVREHLDEWLK